MPEQASTGAGTNASRRLAKFAAGIAPIESGTVKRMVPERVSLPVLSSMRPGTCSMALLSASQYASQSIGGGCNFAGGNDRIAQDVGARIGLLVVVELHGERHGHAGESGVARVVALDADPQVRVLRRRSPTPAAG